MDQHQQNTNTAVSYVRVSTAEQADEGVSLEVQRAKVKAYCTMRGIELIGVVEDAGVSAAKALDARDGGHQVLELVKAKKVVHVVAFKLDRLFRDCADCLTVTKDWDKAGVALHLVDLGGQAVDTSTAMGRFFLTVMAGAAEMERNLIAERTAAALAHKKDLGQRVGQVPFGARLAADGEHLEPDPDEQEVIQRIQALKDEGLSQRAIAARLNFDGTPARGARWHKTTIARVLKAAEAA